MPDNNKHTPGPSSYHYCYSVFLMNILLFIIGSRPVTYPNGSLMLRVKGVHH